MELPTWFYIVFWISISCLMVLFNKAVLSIWGFPFPFFLTTSHMVFATVVTQVLSNTTSYVTAVTERKNSPLLVMKRIFPISIFFAASLVLGNKAFLYLPVAYVQMLKAFTPVVALLISFLLRIETPSVVLFIIVTVISTGVAITTVGELNFSFIGFIFQLFGLLAEACRLTLVDVLVKDLNLDPLSFLYFVAPLSSVLIGFGCYLFEDTMKMTEQIIASNQLQLALLTSACLAFILNVASILLIKNCSALVLTIAGIIKDILLVTFSVTVFHAPVTVLQIFGYSITLTGLHAYKEFKKDPSMPSFRFLGLTTLCSRRLSKSVTEMVGDDSPDFENYINSKYNRISTSGAVRSNSSSESTLHNKSAI